MKPVLLLLWFSLFNQAGMRNGVIVSLDNYYVTVTTQPNHSFGLPIDHLYFSSAKIGDSVWVSFKGKAQAEGVYRDSKEIRE